MAIAAGIPHELFWELSPQEVAAVLERRAEETKASYLRAGLIAATIVNVHRKKGTALVRPSDFIRERPQEKDFMAPAAAARFMDRWAETNNTLPQSEAPPS